MSGKFFLPHQPSRHRFGMERVVRPFQMMEVQPTVDNTKPQRPMPGEDAEAFAKWGGTSRFISQPQNPIETFGYGGFTATWPDPPPREPEEPDPPEVTYTEVSRQEHEIRVENPEDKEQYIMVKKIKTIKMKRNDGVIVEWTFNT
jgi:hypothetical protein